MAQQVRWNGGQRCAGAEPLARRESPTEAAGGGLELGRTSAQACAWKKVTEPAACRDGVQRAQAGFAVSQRRACRTLGVSRATVRYRARRGNDQRLRGLLRELAQKCHRPANVTASGPGGVIQKKSRKLSNGQRGLPRRLGSSSAVEGGASQGGS
jgi:hypothetical protein